MPHVAKNDDRYQPAQAPAPQPSTERKQDARKQWLPVTAVGGIVLFVCGIVWWAAGEHAAIHDARSVADQAAQAVADNAGRLERCRNEGIQRDDELRALISDRRIKEAEVLARLASIEAQLADIKQLLRERRP